MQSGGRETTERRGGPPEGAGVAEGSGGEGEGRRGSEGVEDDGEQRKGKLSRVVADALTRLSDGTASTPRVHRLPRFPRIPSEIHHRPPSCSRSRPTPIGSQARGGQRGVVHSDDQFQHDPGRRKCLRADLVVYPAGSPARYAPRHDKSVSGTEYATQRRYVALFAVAYTCPLHDM